MRLVVGLGNPGKEYLNTRHNVGFMYLDYLVGKDSFTINKKNNAMECIKSINGEKVLFIKPLSYMNLSGEVIKKYIDYYKINSADVLVIHDDLDMPVGRYKLMYNHGDGGHNGVKNTILNMNSKEFLRLKIGISKSNLVNTKDYVLGKFSEEEIKIIYNSFKLLENLIIDYIDLNRDLLIGRYNTKIQEG